MFSKNKLTVFCLAGLLTLSLVGCRDKSDTPEGPEYPSVVDSDDAGQESVTFLTKAPNTVMNGERFYVEYVLIDAEGEDFEMPDFKDFDVVAGPSVSQSSSIQIINGKSSSNSKCTYSFALMPKKSGTFELPAAKVRVNGKLCTSRTAKVTVEGSASSSAPSNSATASQGSSTGYSDPLVSSDATASVSRSNLYFTAEASKRTVYEQEPILVDYKFHSNVSVGLSHIAHQKPDMRGFWTQEIGVPQNINPTIERRGNDVFESGTYLKYVLFPQQTGKLTIPAVNFNCEIRPRGARHTDIFDAFLNGGSINTVVRRVSEPLTIEVLPLPERPAGFSGGVGQFNVETQMMTPEFKTNDIATLRLTVRGIGNMTLIKAPKLKFPKTFDTYDARMTDKTKITADGLRGEVYFDYTFVPREVGGFDIPSADFIYFDTQQRQYVTLHTKALHLDVQKGERSQEDLDAELAMRNADIRDIHASEHDILRRGFGGESNWIGSWRYFVKMLLSGAAGLALLLYLRRRFKRNADVAGTRNRKARKKANKHLQQAEKALAAGNHRSASGQADEPDKNAFYSALSQALRGYFADKLTRDAAAFTNESILSALTEKGLDSETIALTKALLEDCDFARFAPSSDAGQREKDLERASELLNTIDQKLK